MTSSARDIIDGRRGGGWKDKSRHRVTDSRPTMSTDDAATLLKVRRATITALIMCGDLTRIDRAGSVVYRDEIESRITPPIPPPVEYPTANLFD